MSISSTRFTATPTAEEGGHRLISSSGEPANVGWLVNWSSLHWVTPTGLPMKPPGRSTRVLRVISGTVGCTPLLLGKVFRIWLN